ncbi:soluble quino protein glucose dehydrogenase [Tothia fuscella]|uniref:Soluble quino protein glucose dehydrogenase n=1 Tax=Tothia fuscella TaxID=1048955 RepID=A0A9P4NS52_9PEZI|nr:soluble quino protein glucose dehydrogenase [Tothia fuscella]
MATQLKSAVVAALAAVATVQAACPAGLPPKNGAPVVAPGFQARLIANGLSKPRGLVVDSAGHLLAVTNGAGITSFTLNTDAAGCVTVASKNVIASQAGMNHGIDLSADGKTLFASTISVVYAFPYDAATAKAGTPKTVVSGMTSADHTSRTIWASKKVPNMILVSRGSSSNTDAGAASVSAGRSQIRAFDITKGGAQDYTTGGKLIAYGVRNSVGVTEHPVTGGIWSVENSVDDLARGGKDIHQDNPGEEMNYHGYLNGTASPMQGKSYGFPGCYAAWKVVDLPNNQQIKVGTHFSPTASDANCATAIPPRLTFPAHWAPIDIKFNTKGTTAYVTSRGSWNRRQPDGYMLYAIEFNANGEPTHPATSNTAVIPIVSNKNNAACPRGCFRPTGLAWDAQGHLYMASDSTGEIYVITKTDGSGIDDVQPKSSGATPPTLSRFTLDEPSWPRVGDEQRGRED